MTESGNCLKNAERRALHRGSRTMKGRSERPREAINPIMLRAFLGPKMEKPNSNHSDSVTMSDSGNRRCSIAIDHPSDNDRDLVEDIQRDGQGHH